MSANLDKKTVAKNYRFMGIMIGSMVAGALAGWFFPDFGHLVKPLGTVFINMMFCIVVPLVFASISSSVANTKSRKCSGKILGVTVGTFVVTGAIAAVTAAIANGYCSKDTDVTVRAKGGDLIVHYTDEHVTLTGDARLVFTGEVEY